MLAPPIEEVEVLKTVGISMIKSELGMMHVQRAVALSGLYLSFSGISEPRSNLDHVYGQKIQEMDLWTFDPSNRKKKPKATNQNATLTIPWQPPPVSASGY